MSTAVKAPTYRTGKICYIEIPAKDTKESAEFYQRAFGWQTRERGDGSTAFDDTVASAAKAVQAIRSAGGEIVHPVDPQAREVVATFRDPAGNLIGIYQQPGLAESEAPA
jgi:uncharacterized protein